MCHSGSLLKDLFPSLPVFPNQLSLTFNFKLLSLNFFGSDSTFLETRAPLTLQTPVLTLKIKILSHLQQRFLFYFFDLLEYAKTSKTILMSIESLRLLS